MSRSHLINEQIRRRGRLEEGTPFDCAKPLCYRLFLKFLTIPLINRYYYIIIVILQMKKQGQRGFICPRSPDTKYRAGYAAGVSEAVSELPSALGPREGVDLSIRRWESVADLITN